MSGRIPTSDRGDRRAPAPRRSRRAGGVLPGLFVTLLVVLPGACGELLPVIEREELVRSGLAVEVILEYGEFASGARVYGGFGRTSDLGAGFVAHDFGAQAVGGTSEEGLEAVSLLRFGRYPRSAQVLDTTGTTQPDTMLTFLDGELVMRFDSVRSIHNDGPVEIVAHAITEPWDGFSASWEYAIDSIGHRVPWSVPGGGALGKIGGSIWDPEAGDSVKIRVDSAWIAAWADTEDMARGVRVSATTSDVRLRVASALLRIDAAPSINPDTVIQVAANTENRTFLYSPVPVQPFKTLRVGGVPAWRTVLDLDVPSVLDRPPELCDVVGCPVEITPDQVSFAALRLTTRAGARAFAPSDTLLIDLRSVLAPDILPKSPLGPSRVGLAGEPVPHEWFQPPAGEVVEIPITGLVRDLIRGETVDGDPVPGTIAVLSAFEPFSMEYMTFDGATSPAAPALRIVLIFSLDGET